MMKATAVLLAGLAVAAGCGGGGGGGSDGGSAVSGDAATKPGDGTGDVTLSYTNGHPLSLTSSDPTTLANEAEVIRLVNDYRVSIGMNALVDVSAIRDTARANSDHMVIHNYFAHVNPEGDSPGTRITKCGISWTMAGENLAAGYSTPRSAFDAWMASPGHKENIERDGWVNTGVGYYYDSSSTYRWYWTQNFTRP